MRPPAIAALLLVVGAGSLGAEEPAAPPPPLLRNADFSDWVVGKPWSWTLELGAQHGEGPESRVTKGPKGGVRIEGDAATKRWLLLAQPVDLAPKSVVRLRWEVRALGLQLDPGQRGNAYVGLRTHMKDSGTLEGFRVSGELREVWTPGELVARMPEPPTRTSVVVFLSQTGALEVRGLSLEVLAPEQSFDVLVDHMARHYSFFAVKEFDWAKHTPAFRARALAAKDEAGFVEVLREMLAALEDLHVTIRRTDGTVVPTVTKGPTPNVEIRPLMGMLKKPVLLGKAGFSAELTPDVGYLAVTSLMGPQDDHIAMREALKSMFGRKGLILDLRGNQGGDETRATWLARMLNDEPRVYARRRWRNGPLPGDFGARLDARLMTEPGVEPFAGPVVVLLGPACVSSGEGMALMLDALPNVRTVGQRTRGASGGAAPVTLPNDVEVTYSRWVTERMDGALLEGRGVVPDVPVVHEGRGDPTLAAGLKELERMLAKPR